MDILELVTSFDYYIKIIIHKLSNNEELDSNLQSILDMLSEYDFLLDNFIEKKED